MSAFKGLLRAGKPNIADLARLIRETLAGISRHTIDGRDEELSKFRESLMVLGERLNEHTSLGEADSVVASALELLQDYNQRALQDNKLRNAELKGVMRTMTETVTFLSESRSRSVHQLQFMERELEQATQIDDIRMLHSRITACLDVVREETVRMQSESDQRSKEVRQQIDQVVKLIEPPPRFGSMDAVTGLPSRKLAESAIADAITAGGDVALCVFAVTRLASINSRYGRTVGDEVMLHVANHFANRLSSDAMLYRWSGPALVALTRLDNNLEHVRRAWTKAASVKQEINLRVKERSIFVLVETALHFQLLGNSVPQEEVVLNLDKFVGDKAVDEG